MSLHSMRSEAGSSHQLGSPLTRTKRSNSLCPLLPSQPPGAAGGGCCHCARTRGLQDSQATCPTAGGERADWSLPSLCRWQRGWRLTSPFSSVRKPRKRKSEKRKGGRTKERKDGRKVGREGGRKPQRGSGNFHLQITGISS